MKFAKYLFCLVLLFILGVNSSSFAQVSRTFQWDNTGPNGFTVSTDKWCADGEGYFEMSPKHRMRTGITTLDDPRRIRDAEQSVYVWLYPNQVWGDIHLYAGSNYLGYYRVDTIRAATDKIRMIVEDDSVNVFYNNTVIHTFNLASNQSYRMINFDYVTSDTEYVSDLNAVASVALVEPCSSQASNPATRSFQWNPTGPNGFTVSLDKWCPAGEGIWEMTPVHRMRTGITTLDNPRRMSDAEQSVYVWLYPNQIYGDIRFYKGANYEGYYRVDSVNTAIDKVRMEVHGSLVKLFYNSTMIRSFEIDANEIYRLINFDYDTSNVEYVSDLQAVASISLIDPCSSQDTNSTNYIVPPNDGPAYNWVNTKVYNESEELASESRVYLDKMGSRVQQQVKNYASGDIIAQQYVKDKFGRTSLASLPAPINKANIEYQSDFLRSATGGAFTYIDFDLSSTKDNPRTTSNFIPGTVGYHYSNNGESQVATTAYPFSSVQYHLDGSIKKISDAGEHHRMGSGHETRNFALMSGGELAHLYGYHRSYIVDAPASDPWQLTPQSITQNLTTYKQVVIGADGVEQIQFTSAEGQLLATAVSGQTGANCTNQRARHELRFRSTRSTRIHLPAATKQSLHIGYSATYLVAQNPLNYIQLTISDLQSDELLVEGTDYQLSIATNNRIKVTFLGQHANESGFYRIAYDYTNAYLDDYIEFYIPGYEPPVTVEYELDYSHWTLNYYDVRGRLRQTIPPKGIRCDFYDISQLGNYPYYDNKDLYVNANTYLTQDVLVSQVILPSLPNGITQSVDLTTRILVKPGILPDNWTGSINGYPLNQGTVPVTVDLPITGPNNNPNPVIDSFTLTQFESAFPVPLVGDIESGNTNALNTPNGSNNQARGPVVPGTNPKCWNGVLDFGEVTVDCGGICKSCEEECSDPDRFMAAFRFDMAVEGLDQNGQWVSLHTTSLYRYLGVSCDAKVVEMTPDDLPTEFDHEVLASVVSGQNLQQVRVRLVEVKVRTAEIDPWGAFDINQARHRFLRYLYPRVDGEREVFFADPIPHTMPQTYVYDGLNRLVAVEDPDRGRTEYIYDEEGKLRFSQDAWQRGRNAFSYLSYDARGRVIEDGEYIGSSFTFPAGYYANQNTSGSTNIYTIKDQLDGLTNANGDRKDQSFYTYDEAAPDVPIGTVGNDYQSTFVEGRLSKSSNANRTTWYKYDFEGQLSATVQSYPVIGLKTMDYEYDCFNRLVRSTYQKGSGLERFAHLYSYDVAGRLQYIETKKGEEFPKLHAHYEFYQTGALKRTELGDQLQGLDYTYTITGALKAVNHPLLKLPYDPGQDGRGGNNGDFAKDAFGFALDYYSTDYVRTGTHFNYGLDNSNDYFDGRIKSVRWNTRDNNIGGVEAERIFNYEYDWKQQLTKAEYGFYYHHFSVNDANGNGDNNNPLHGTFFNGGIQSYLVSNITYDLNGNIQTLSRKDITGTDMDVLDYIYEHTDENSGYTTATNKLRQVRDAAGFLNQNDVRDQIANNYTYHEDGKIWKDAEKDVSYQYNSFGKLDAIYSHDGSRQIMSFLYDENGDRLRKTVFDDTGSPELNTLYLRAGDGTLIAVYEQDISSDGPYLRQEQYLDGGSLGIYYPTLNQYVYHLTDHLGNVRATIDREKDSNGDAQTLSWADYYPFGMVSNSQVSNPRYRLGYQGQELDAKVGLYAFQLRNYDPRLGKWLSPDPYEQHWSPYLAMSNNPVSFVDPDGGYDGRITYYEDGVRVNGYEIRAAFNSGTVTEIEFNGFRFQGVESLLDQYRIGVGEDYRLRTYRGAAIGGRQARYSRYELSGYHFNIGAGSVLGKGGEEPNTIFENKLTGEKVIIDDGLERVIQVNDTDFQIAKFFSSKVIHNKTSKDIAEAYRNFYFEHVTYDNIFGILDQGPSISRLTGVHEIGMSPIVGELLTGPGKKKGAQQTVKWLSRQVLKASPSLKKTLPAWKKVNIDIGHIISGHTVGGARAKASGLKDIFPEYMTEIMIERAVRNAYKNVSKKLYTQGDRVFLKGQTKEGMIIEMWLNRATKTIETAWPKF